MFAVAGNVIESKTTSHKVIIPFYAYGAISLLAATVLLFFSNEAFTQHHFHPKTLAITHAMALGWGTMIILGASHQLVPVLIEGKLFSNSLAYASFLLAGIGIPFLVYCFYVFDLGWPSQLGGWLINTAVLCYLINLGVSIQQSKKENVHAVFVFTAVSWLLLTTIVGLLLLYNFSGLFLPSESLHYLSLHAHMGVLGWFLLLVIGVGSRLIPMFLISKYQNSGILWVIFWLINTSLIGYLFLFFADIHNGWNLVPAMGVITALTLFGNYCANAYSHRIRKQVDAPMKISLLSVVMMVLPAILIITLLVFLLTTVGNQQIILAYGFAIFFGWITAIIFGMTFKTLPFIVWNKVYHLRAGIGKTPSPKELFSNPVFKAMSITYLSGFLLFMTGILLPNPLLLRAGSGLLFCSALFYNWNVFKTLFHKSAI